MSLENNFNSYFASLRMQIFVKTLTGKTITMEVDIEQREIPIEYIIYLNYTSKSHVLTGRPSDALREEMKTRKLATYHPRLYPQGKGGQPSEKGWLIKADKLDEVKELLKKSGCEPKIVPHKNTIARMFEDIRNLTSEPEVSESDEESDSSSNFDEILVKPVSKEEKAKILEELKDCLAIPEKSTPDRFKGTVLSTGIGYGAKESSDFDLYVCSHPGEHKGLIITHIINKQVSFIWYSETGDKFPLIIVYGEETRAYPDGCDLKRFLDKHFNQFNDEDKIKIKKTVKFFLVMNGGDPNKNFLWSHPNIWKVMENWVQ